MWQGKGAVAGWDESLLSPVSDINEQLLRSLKTQAAAERAPRLVRALQAQFAALDDAALSRAAACPYLLLDAGFADPGLWLRPPTLAVHDGARAGYFGGETGVRLVRRTLLFAWHLARANRLAARVLAGMDAATCERLALWRLTDLDTVAELSPHWVLPRWESQPLVWRQLLQRAAAPDCAGLRRVQLRGLQLLAGQPLRTDASLTRR